MKLLHLAPRPDFEGGQRVLLFGTGAVGGAIRRALSKQADVDREDTLPFDWNAAPLQQEQAAAILDRITLALPDPQPSVDLVWAAGRCGFAASEAQTANELASFRHVLTLARQIHERHALRFHLVSSAGGLFEGQIAVAARTAPAPLRPYGRLKLEQEKLVADSGLRQIVYRPSTLYGLLRPHTRHGLIQTFVLSGLQHAVANVFGRLSTLRDYVFEDDVGSFIARRVLSRAAAETSAIPHLLACGRPVSIEQVRSTVERVLRRRIYVTLRPDDIGSADITFAAPPQEWQPPVDLETGVRRICESWTLRGTQPI